MANVFKNIEYLNIIEPSKDYCSAFELSDVLKFSFEQKIDINKISLFRGNNVFGFCYEVNLFFKENSGNNDAFLKMIDDSLFATCSSNGRYVALLSKFKYLYLIYIPEKKIFLKQDLKLENENIYAMKTIEINETTSEIWLFARQKVIVIRNINFSHIYEVITGHDKQEKSNLSQQIKLNYVTFPFTNEQSEIVDVNILKCRQYNQLIVGILYLDMFAYILVNTNEEESSVMFTHAAELEDLGIDLCQSRSASISFASDEMNVFILDGKKILWIYNFLAESVCGTLTNPSDMCLGFQVSRDNAFIADTVVFINEIDNASATLEIVSFPKMDVIEEFPVANNSIIMPFHQHSDPILIIQPLQNFALLKSISRLDPNIKLREIIAIGNYDQARKFASIYRLDQEIIYIDELNRLIREWDNNHQSLTSDQQIRLHCCIQELRTYFHFDTFMQLIIITMSSFSQQQSHLTALRHQALRHIPNSTEGDQIYQMVATITKECERFHIFALIYPPIDYSIHQWNAFRNEDIEDIWFYAIKQADINVIKEIWSLSQKEIESIFSTSSSEFCHNLLILGLTMINNQSSPSKFSTFFEWLTSEVVPRQIEIAPEQLAFLIGAIESIVRKMEATHNIDYRNECVLILERIIANVERIYLSANTPKMKAHVIAARLPSGLERVNPIKRLISLKNDLYQIQRLFNNFSLDLNLDVLTNETGISLAMRILDQTSNNDLVTVPVWEKFRSFLKEFEIRETEFYLHYIYEKLISRVSCKSEHSANDSSGEYSMIFTRFLFLLDKVEDRQAQLEGLAEFASNTDMPFKEQLNNLIQARIAANSSSNPAVAKLQQLLTTSQLTPMSNRLGIKLNSKKFNPKKLLAHILQNESQSSAEQFQSDIDIIMRAFRLEELVLLEQRCHVYVNELFFTEESISYESFRKLSKILGDVQLTNGMRMVLLKVSFNQLHYLMNQIYIWDYGTLEFISEVAFFMAERLPEEGSKNYFLEIFGILRFCIRWLHSDLHGDTIHISQILGKGFSLSDITKQPNFTQQTIFNFFYRQFIISLTNNIDNIDCLQTSGGIFELIQSKENLCKEMLNLKNIYFRIILDVLASIGNDFISSNQLLATWAVYNGLEIIFKSVDISSDIDRYSQEIRNLLIVLLEIDISSNVFMVYKILETLQKFLGIYIVNNIKYHSHKYNIIQRIILHLKSLTRNFACLHKPEYFDLKTFNKTLFQEKPNLLDSLTGFVPFIKSGLTLISSKEEHFDRALIVFINECQLVLPLFLENNLLISGYLSGLSLLVLLSDKAPLSIYAQIDSREKVCLKAWKHILRSRILDVNLLSGLMIICSPSVAYREIETLIRKCSKNNKVLLSLYSIAFRVLQNYRDNDIPNRLPTLKAMQKEVHKKIWSQKLSNFNINIKSLNKYDLNKTKLEIFQHPKMTLNIVEEFLEDFQFKDNKYYFEYFREIIKTDLSTCSSFEEYKWEIERVINHAETIWKRIDISIEFINEIVTELGNSVCNSSQYQYELLAYLYDKLNSFNGDYSWEIKIIKLLDSWRRTSPATVEEINFVQKFHTRNAEYLMKIRLPFHAVIGDNPMSVIGPELNDTNTSVWLEIYNSINQMKTNRIDIINKDMLLKTSVKNQITKFLIDQNLTNNNIHKEHIFMGEYFKYCSLWFNKILVDIPTTFDNLVMNDVFMQIVKEFQSYLVIGEQLIKIMEIALVWVNRKLESGFCVSREELLKWQLEIIENLQNLRIEEILYRYNFYKSYYLENLSDHHLLLETILHRERLNIGKVSAKRLNDVVTVAVEIAKITNIDIEEFACQFTKVGLKLVTVTQDSYSESDGDLSMLNTSCEISIDESRLEQKEYIYVDIHELEILSLNDAIRIAVKNSLFAFLKENMLTLQQWNNIFQYFFHTFRISEDQDVDYLCTSNWYCAFQIFLELHLMNIHKYNFTEISNSEYIIKRKLREFSLQDKTSMVKQLYCGGHSNDKGGANRAIPVRNPNHIAVLRDIINTYPETIDFHDEHIKSICAKVGGDHY